MSACTCPHPAAVHLADQTAPVQGMTCQRSGAGRGCRPISAAPVAFTYCMMCRPARPGAPLGDPCCRSRRALEAAMDAIEAGQRRPGG